MFLHLIIIACSIQRLFKTVLCDHIKGAISLKRPRNEGQYDLLAGELVREDSFLDFLYGEIEDFVFEHWFKLVVVQGALQIIGSGFLF